jgi:hypothetical protein
MKIFAIGHSVESGTGPQVETQMRKTGIQSQLSGGNLKKTSVQSEIASLGRRR